MSSRRSTTPLSPIAFNESYAENWAHHMVEDPSCPEWFLHHKHMFVYTLAGKPAFSRYGNDIELAPFMATLLAITSVVNDNNDELKYVRSNEHLYVFLNKGPLQFCCVSNTKEQPEIIIKQLQFLFCTICSIIPFPSIQNIFDKSYGTDFRNVIGGTYNQMKCAISHGNMSSGLLFNAFDIEQFPTTIRNYLTENIQTIVSQTNIELFKANNDCILFSALISNSKIVVLGKRSANLTPMDSQVLISFVRSISSRKTISWMPLCLNDFNEKAQIHVFVKYITTSFSIVLVATQPTSMNYLTKCYKTFKHTIKQSKFWNQIEAPTPTVCPYIIKNEILHFVVYSKNDNQVFMSPFTIHTTRKEQKRLFRIYENLYIGLTKDKLKQEMFVFDDEIIVTVENNTHYAFITFSKFQENKVKMMKTATAVLSWAIKEDSLWIKKFAQFS
ncbi:hypothetical protein ENUP19_0361G0006 [Entamoeba nuttalli]|uniref:Sand family protein n=2 Tax=Entamoeba nuttalli TaxID=412467 RepID=K2H2S4_ENTNP|nr:sand family protein [Entamoeba nuttalli P19]EKE41828.1 sand family protein [Entamoeba nuttalli P19]|eukprot:XP_008855837.1 sand family protein [Entamoeba nuttalli P19]